MPSICRRDRDQSQSPHLRLDALQLLRAALLCRRQRLLLLPRSRLQRAPRARQLHSQRLQLLRGLHVQS